MRVLQNVSEIQVNIQLMNKLHSDLKVHTVLQKHQYWQVANYRESYGLFACSGIMFNHESILRPTRFVTRKICQSAAKIALGKESSLKLEI